MPARGATGAERGHPAPPPTGTLGARPERTGEALEPLPAPGLSGQDANPSQAASIPPPATPEIVRDGAHGRHPTIRRAIARFVADVAEMPRAEIEARWDADLAEHLAGRAAATKKQYVMRYRSALSAAFGPDHPALGVVSARGLSREIKATRRGHAPARPERGEADTPGPGPKSRVHPLAAEGEDTRPAIAAGDPSPKGRQRPPASPGAAPGRHRPVGRPGAVREAAAAFAARLRQAASPAEVEALWATELAAHAGKADRTLKRNIAEHYRPAIRRILGADHPALSIVKLPAEMSDRIRADDIARVAASHRSQVAVPRWRDIVQRATALLASDAPLDLVAGLLLVTGRRPFEVCCTGRFTPAPLPGGSPGARSRWTVLFSGQAKTKGRPGTRHDTAYEIPVLAEARRVIAALDALRATPEGRAWAGVTNEEFRATTLRLALGGAVARAYGDLWPEGDRLEPRALRPLYAEIAHKRFGPANVTKNSFFAAALGHTPNDLHTSLSYMDYHLPDQAGDEAAAAARKAAAGVTDRLLRQTRPAGLDPG